MRHTWKSSLPKPVALLPPRVVCPASFGLLVPAASRPNRLSPSLTATRLRAVPLPAITPRAHHQLASASVAAQQSPVARRIRCLSHGQRAGCESARKALYFPRGARPPWTAAGLVFKARSFSQQRIIPHHAPSHPHQPVDSRPRSMTLLSAQPRSTAGITRVLEAAHTTATPRGSGARRRGAVGAKSRGLQNPSCKCGLRDADSV